jgi:hypothetical protein
LRSIALASLLHPPILVNQEEMVKSRGNGKIKTEWSNQDGMVKSRGNGKIKRKWSN